MNLVELILSLVFSKLIYPAMMEFALRREADPAFKAASDLAYGEVKNATSTLERWKAIRKIHALKNSS